MKQQKEDKNERDWESILIGVAIGSFVGDISFHCQTFDLVHKIK